MPARSRLVAAVALLVALAALAAAPAAQARAPRAVLAFLPEGGDDNPAPVLDRLAARPQLAIGLVSATQGLYTPAQSLIDLSAGSRTAAAIYHPRLPPAVELVPGGDGTGFILGWSRVLARARTAPAEIRPGILATTIPDGGAYAGVRGGRNAEAVAAADAAGDVAAVSLGRTTDIAQRARRLLVHHRLVVVGLAPAAQGDAALDQLLRDRRHGDVVVVMQTPPRALVAQLLPAGVATPVASADGVLTSPTTRMHGVVATIDLTATILDGLGLPVPDEVRGQPVTVEATRDAGALTTTKQRLAVISGRRTPVVLALLFTWAALTLALGLVADRRGVRAGMRVGGLAMLWVPSLLLFAGWLAPTRLVEIGAVVGGSFALAALTDRLVRWPRGPLVPAVVGLAAYGVDLALGSTTLVRSLLGVNPRGGARFYGLGNELESTLVVLLVVALGALLMRRADFESVDAPFGEGPGRSRGAAAVVVIAGVVAAVFVGSGRLGADVGGVLTVAGGVAVMAILMLPGTPSRRMIALALATPVLAVAGLALLDLVTGGNGHFTRTILEAHSGRALQDVVARRYALAFDTLRTGPMPFITALAVLAAAYGVRYRARIYAPLRGSPSWRAALAGGLSAAAVGAAFNDSGPILLVFGVFVLACVTAYVRGDPKLASDDDRLPGCA